MPYRHKFLGTAVREHWGSVRKVVPDFGEPRGMRAVGKRLRWCIARCAPLAAGMGLIGLLESAGVMPVETVARRCLPERQVMVTLERAETPAGPVQLPVLPRWP